jgi:hypothetical protein
MTRNKNYFVLVQYLITDYLKLFSFGLLGGSAISADSKYYNVFWQMCTAVSVDPHHFNNLDPHPDSHPHPDPHPHPHPDPHPHQIKINIRKRIKIYKLNPEPNSHRFAREAKMYGI